MENLGTCFISLIAFAIVAASGLAIFFARATHKPVPSVFRAPAIVPAIVAWLALFAQEWPAWWLPVLLLCMAFTIAARLSKPHGWRKLFQIPIGIAEFVLAWVIVIAAFIVGILLLSFVFVLLNGIFGELLGWWDYREVSDWFYN